MPVLDNQRHEIFAQEVAKGTSQREAYTRAGYVSKSEAAIDANAARLIATDKVSARVKEIQGLAVDRAVVDRQWVIAKLVENVERAMQASAATDENGETKGEYKYDGSVANRALELLGKELGMFIERRENTNRTFVIGAQSLTDEEWEAKYCLETPAGAAASTH